jgi:Mrp family chromosome partitioning ATPase
MSKMLSALRQLEAKSGDFPHSRQGAAPPQPPDRSTDVEAWRDDAALAEVEPPPEVTLPLAVASEAHSAVDSETTSPSEHFEAQFAGLASLLGQAIRAESPGESHFRVFTEAETAPAPEAPPEPVATLPIPAPTLARAPLHHTCDAPFEAIVARNLSRQPLGGQITELAAKILEQFPHHGAAIAMIAIDPDDHAAFVSTHLGAMICRQQDGEVLLIDANVTHRQLSAELGCSDRRGLVDSLAGSIDDAHALITPTDIPRLAVLPAGRDGIPSPAEIEANLPALLGELRQSRRLTIVKVAADSGVTRVVLRDCDGAYILVRLGHTSPADAQLAVQALTAADTPLLGCIVTNAPSR